MSFDQKTLHTLQKVSEQKNKLERLRPLIEDPITRKEAFLPFISALFEWQDMMLLFARSDRKDFRLFAFSELEKTNSFGIENGIEDFFAGKIFANMLISSKNPNEARTLIFLIESPYILSEICAHLFNPLNPEAGLRFIDDFSEKILSFSSQLNQNSDEGAIIDPFFSLGACYSFSKYFLKTDLADKLKAELERLLLNRSAPEVIEVFLNSFTFHFDSSFLDSDSFYYRLESSLPTVELILDHISRREMRSCSPSLIDLKDFFDMVGVQRYSLNVLTVLKKMGYVGEYYSQMEH